MGYQTDFIGYLHVQPSLNKAEMALIDQIAHMPPPGTAGDVGAMGRVDDALLELASRAPQGWSNWETCGEGCCLSYDGGDKANHMIPWLKHLMSTYLVPGAAAAGRPGFQEFSCDHLLNGMVVGSGGDSRELFSITVRENEVEVELLWPGVPEWSDYPALGYQEAIDRFRDWRAAHRLEEARTKVLARRAEAGAPYPFPYR
jgi:hypothetical protein